MKKILIIGAGLTGLSVAYHLNKESNKEIFSYKILEKCSRPGGLCKTEEEKGFLFDYTGHLLHFRTSYFQSMVKEVLGDNLLSRNRSAWIYSNGVYTKYPFQGNLYGLPKSIIEECLYEFCQAYFHNNGTNIGNFHDWIQVNFGKGIARHFMTPYNEKLWKRHPKKLTCDWLGRFVPKPDLRQVIQGALSPKGNTLGYNASFYYPKEGGIESLIKQLSQNIFKINTNHQVKSIDLNTRHLTTTNGKVFPFDFLVSTLPITELIRMLNNKPKMVREAARHLKHVSVLNINLGIKRKIHRKHWVYIPEDHLAFYRIGFPSNFSNKTAPPGHSSIYTEISYDPNNKIDLEWARKKVLDDLVEIGVIKEKSDIVAEKIMDIPFAYVIYDKHRGNSLAEIKNFLEKEKIFSIGRYGGWKYSAMEDAFLDGKKTAAIVSKLCRKTYEQNSSPDYGL